MASHDAPSSRSVRTRAALIAAGFELLVDRPIDAIPIDDVVAKAGVAKGSFFNHFSDKQDFASAIATEVRLELEARVTQANSEIADPIERIAGGLRVCIEFARDQPKRTTVLLRSHSNPTARAHPLNRGLAADFEAARAQGLLCPEASESGVLFWMGICQAVMANVVESNPGRIEAQKRLGEMLVLGLTGLGIDRDRALMMAFPK